MLYGANYAWSSPDVVEPMDLSRQVAAAHDVTSPYAEVNEPLDLSVVHKANMSKYPRVLTQCPSHGPPPFEYYRNASAHAHCHYDVPARGYQGKYPSYMYREQYSPHGEPERTDCVYQSSKMNKVWGGADPPRWHTPYVMQYREVHYPTAQNGQPEVSAACMGYPKTSSAPAAHVTPQENADSDVVSGYRSQLQTTGGSCRYSEHEPPRETLAWKRGKNAIKRELHTGKHPHMVTPPNIYQNMMDTEEESANDAEMTMQDAMENSGIVISNNKHCAGALVTSYPTHDHFANCPDVKPILLPDHFLFGRISGKRPERDSYDRNTTQRSAGADDLAGNPSQSRDTHSPAPRIKEELP